MDSDDTTSPQRQRLEITARAAARGSEIIGWAEDLDVSASKVHPMKRPELARWLARPAEFDELIFWRLDRLVRRVFPDFADMIKWSQEHDVALVSATEHLDFGGPLGQLMAMAVGTFAQLEAQAISQRVTGTQAYLRTDGRWAGGAAPYGYQPVKRAGGKGWELTDDPGTAELLREAIRRVLAGEAVNAITADFNRRAIPSPRDVLRARRQRSGKAGKPVQGDPWRRTALYGMLRSPVMLGQAVHGGKPVTGDDGMPVTRGPALITQEEFDRLQLALTSATRAQTRTQTPSLLLGVAFCGSCGGPDSEWVPEPLYRSERYGRAGRSKLYGYYLCRASGRRVEYGDQCSARSIPAGWLDARAASSFLDMAGELEIMQRIWQPGEDHSEELAQVRSALGGVRAEFDRGAYGYPGGQDEYAARVDRLSARLSALAELPSRPASYVLSGTGRTFRQAWDSSDVAERRRLMLDSGFHLYAWHLDGALMVATARGQGIAEAAAAAATRDATADRAIRMGTAALP